jgi:hypothetical protein
VRGSASDRVRWALEELVPYLHSYVNGVLQRSRSDGGPVDADITALMGAILDNWNVFRPELRSSRSYLHEVRDVRNALMHFRPFSDGQARRAIDTIRLVAEAIGAPTERLTALAAPSPTSEPRVATVSATPQSSPPELANRRRSPGRYGTSQRDVMRAIWARCAPDEERAVREYAAAEQCGEAPRKQNTHGLSAEQYARALLSDGLAKGWLSR